MLLWFRCLSDLEDDFRRTVLAAPRVVLVPVLLPVEEDEEDEDEEEVVADGRLPHPSAVIGRSRIG